MIHKEHFGTFDAPDLAPFVVCEETARGWLGLTADGEVFNVEAAAIPDDSLCVMRNGRPVGHHALPKQLNDRGTIAGYLDHFNRALDLFRANNPAPALCEIDEAINVAATARATFNRAMILLSLGRWIEGFAEYARCEQEPLFMRAAHRQALDYGLRPWQGEDIAGKRLLLIHNHGFGDSIMTLRYVSQLKGMGADVVLLMPPELRRLAAQCAPVVSEIVPADYFCPMLMLLHVLRQTPEQIPLAPYLAVDKAMSDRWLSRIDPKSIGIAWSVGKYYDGDYPRAAPLAKFIEHLDGAKLISIQQQREDANTLGVKTFEFEDFADCAGLMMLLDEIVTVDTAALHLAGAIGHPRVTALLSHWASWRWFSPLYDGVTFCRQQKPGDWASAFAQRERKSQCQ